MKLAELNALVAAVCPIDGINSAGVIWFKPEATDEQKAAAQAVVQVNLSLVDESSHDIRSEILSLSQKALSSGFLHIMMFDMMQRYLVQAQAIVPTVTEADLINPQSPYYSKPYADTKVYYDQLVALQDLK